MPLFRFHRGSLEESLKTTIVVKTFNDMVKEIVFSDLINHPNRNSPAAFKIEPYPAAENNFDQRIGWYTHLVSCTFHEKDIFYPVGFLSEDFNG